MSIFQHATYEQARNHALELATEAARTCGRCTLLLRSYDETVRVKRDLAEAGCPLGVQAVTLKDWLQDSWELFGDGRHRFDAVQRELMVRRVLLDAVQGAKESCADEASLSVTPGIVDLAGSIARDALPAALAADRSQFRGATLQVLDALHAYAALLNHLGLVDDSQVVADLRSRGVLKGVPVVALDLQTTAAQDDLLGSLDADVLLVSLDQQVWEADLPLVQEADSVVAPELRQLAAALFRPDFQNPVQAQGAVRFAYAAGPYAHDQLAVEQLMAAVDDVAAGSGEFVEVVYAAKDPRQCFMNLAGRLADQGVSSSVRAYVPVRRTDFGRAWIALVDFLDTEGEPGTFAPSRIGDFALSAFSFMSVSSAQKLDERVRGWRGQTVDEALTDLSAFGYEERRDFMAAVVDGNLVEAVNLQIAAMVTRMNWPESHRMLQINAARAVREVLVRAGDLGLPLEQVQEELLQAAVPVGGSVDARAEFPRAHVHFTTLRHAAQEPPASANMLVVDDLTAQDYPLKDDRTATDEVMDQIGAFKPKRRIDQLRVNFQHVLRVPRQRVLLVRCLNDSDAKELRPAALLEELVDCYRCDPQNPSEVDKVMGLPGSLRPYGVTLGEDQLDCALDPRQPQAQAAAVRVEQPQVALRPEEAENVLLPGRTEQELLDFPVLSPSAIEKYLQCPYKWFVESRLGASSGIEAGFGPLERGSFAHKILEMTHEHLRMTGQRRVTRENARQAQETLKELFYGQLEEERYLYESSAYVPLTKAEEWAADALMRQLQAYVEWEAGLLPDFAPQGVELNLGEDQPIEYAGLHVHGRLDRLDVDPYGRAVVVDYKGSAPSTYAFEAKATEGMVTPLHVQTLIYAQMVRRRMGLTPVGAVYVSYGKRLGISGAYDAQVLHPTQDLCNINAEKCGSPSFLDDLDRVEEELAAVLERMKAGEVDPRPRSKDVCTYCAATNCPMRGVDQGKE
ncbi:MAG: PD-(D/E)XK nuclease family protein [Coriobacteriia bacterium]|nr:PD-(D/E)XK nuclease family protein [Coriobacteriia bacterium]